MGNRINALFTHHLDWTDREQTLSVLSRGLPYDQAIGEYWSSLGETVAQEEEWTSEPPLPPQRHCNYHQYSSPNGLFVNINPHAGRIRTTARWRGFLSIPPLRKVYWDAIRNIAMLFHAPEIWYMGDDDCLWDVFWEGGTVSQCILDRTERVGPPLQMPRSPDERFIEPDPERKYVWYYEHLTLDD